MELQIEKIIKDNSIITIYNSGKTYSKVIKDERNKKPDTNKRL